MESAEQDLYQYVTEEDVKLIVKKYGYENEEIEKYYVTNASDNLLGFMADYWKLEVHLQSIKKVLHFFIKALSRSNISKKELAIETKMYEKEVIFYTDIKPKIDLPDLKPSSPRFVTMIEDAMVFEDLRNLQYIMRDKYQKYDIQHTVEAIKSLARYHACSIVYEEKKSKDLGRVYTLYEDYHQYMGRAGYDTTSEWYIQCMQGGLEALRTFANYDEGKMKRVDERWRDVWMKGLELSEVSTEHRNVICHRDLWNNNILFHYKDGNKSEPDHCVFVDFQGLRYQPPAGDIMFLLYCNLKPKFRDENLDAILKIYLDVLTTSLSQYGVNREDIMTDEQFYKSVKEQALWGLIVCACLSPLALLEGDITTELFSDTEKFNEILLKDKATFIKKRMRANPIYKEIIMEIYNEIVDKYCLND